MKREGVERYGRNDLMGKLVDIELGAIAKPLSEQIPEAVMDRRDVAMFQKDSDAISRLYIRGLIPESQARSAKMKLMKKMQKAIK